MRFDLWTRRVQVDAAAGHRADVVGDVATLEWIRDRLPLPVEDETRVDDELRVLDGQARSGELAAASETASRMRGTVAG
jgi:hypothetical protein